MSFSQRLEIFQDLSCSIIPSVGAHGSELVAASDKRVEFISGCVIQPFFKTATNCLANQFHGLRRGHSF